MVITNEYGRGVGGFTDLTHLKRPHPPPPPSSAEGYMTHRGYRRSVWKCVPPFQELIYRISRLSTRGRGVVLRWF